MKLLVKSLSLLALFIAEIASADGWKPSPGPIPFPIKVQINRMTGSGCPKGSARATLSPDQSTLSVLFDQMGTQMASGSGVLQDRKQCTIQLGVKFDGKYRVAIVGSDMRGYASVPAGARSTISVKHRSVYSYTTAFEFNKQLIGPAEENIEMNNRFSQNPMWSQCGTQMKYSQQVYPFMYINIDIQSQSQNTSEDLITMIDSFDFSAAPLSYQLAWMVGTGCPN